MATSGDRFWEFTGEDGSFRAHGTNRISRLYFPLGNEAGLLSAITPHMHGDIKTGFNTFLTVPASEQDLHATRYRRDFWIRPEGGVAWCVNTQGAPMEVEAGFLWHRASRKHVSLPLKVEMLNFVPVSEDTVELMEVRVTHTGGDPVSFTPTSALPIFARSADNLRDHRHVTSLLNRITAHPHGVVVKPTMSFDERGHRVNSIQYAVLGFEEKGGAPVGSFPSVDLYCGEGGDFDRPAAVLENREPSDWKKLDGREAMGALRFGRRTLNAGESCSYILMFGVADKVDKIARWKSRFGNREKFLAALEANRAYWQTRLDPITFRTGDKTFSNWIKWVSLQPTLRKVFGCGFLPDFDYGRGGRGWRDLWQDCLALSLLYPREARSLLLNNYGGVRFDGSNATIIGRAPGEFIADRNSITRVWMDHGVWPYLTTELYIHQTGDASILFEKAAYFRDPQLRRARAKDATWTEVYGRRLKNRKGRVYEGTVLEHILVQHLTAFFNVGEHNMIRLEDADWNDGLDMAHKRGESVAFSAFYAGNLASMANLLEELQKREGFREIVVAEELLILLDRIGRKGVNYSSAKARQKQLEAYFDAITPEIKGKTVRIPVAALVGDLRAKAEHLANAVRTQEWVKVGGEEWFNGYYDNEGRRVEGKVKGRTRMTLTGQVFPIMSGVATDEQIARVWKAVARHLRDAHLGGFRLNTDFGEIQPALGRAFSFAYGEKENGAFFNHMAVMFANALYRRGFVKEGFEVLNSIFRMAVNTPASRIYPGLPEYFNGEGRGMYHYLTGSGSWYILTYLTQVCGVRGSWGDLILAPKLVRAEFAGTGRVEVRTSFGGKRIRVVYLNREGLEFGDYQVSGVTANGQPVDFDVETPTRIRISRKEVARWKGKGEIELVATLSRMGWKAVPGNGKTGRGSVRVVSAAS